MMESPNYGDFFMIYVKDSYTLENEQTVILLEAYPETLFTNSSDEEAVLEYSHDGTKWNTLLTLAPKQKQTTAVTSRYIRQTTQTTVEAKAVGNHITPLVLADNPLHSGADFSNYITKPQLDSVIAKVNDKTALLATQEQLQTATQTQTRALTAETQQRHSQIDTINQTITRNKQAQDELINQKANQTALTALEAKVTANTAKNQSQDTEIAKKANQASLTAETTARNQAIEAVKGTIANNKQTQDSIINQLRADMATKANQSALETETANRTSDIVGLTQIVNTHKQQLDGQIRALEQNKVDKNTLNQQLNAKANQSDIDRINTTIDQKALKLNQVTAGNGLTGGGTLANSFQIVLGTPSTITQNSTNTTTATSHSHAIDRATTTQAGIVTLSHETNGTNKTKAASEFALGEVRRLMNNLSNPTRDQTPNLSLLTWSSITDKPQSFTPSSHVHQASDIADLHTILSKYATKDEIPLINIAAIDSKITTEVDRSSKKDAEHDDEIASLKRTKADLSHTHTMSEVTDLSAELERYALKTELNDISVDTSHLATKSSVNELSEQIATKADQSHRHTITEVSGLQGILNNKLNSNASARSAQKLTTPRRINGIAFDGTQDITLPTPTANVSWSAISNKPTNFTPSAHRHAISDITNLQRELDNKAPRNHSHTWNSITNKPANFTPSAHTHQWSNISNVPSATINNAGIVQLSNSTNGVRQTIAATEFALNEVRKLINSSSRRGSITGVLNRQSHRYFYQRRHGTSSTDAVYSDIDTFTFPDGRIVYLVRLEGIKPAFFDVNTTSVGGSDHTPAKIINLPTAMPNKIISAIPQITSSSLGSTLSSCIVGWDWTYNIDPISGNTRSKSQVRIQFSGYQGNTTNNKIDLSIIVEGY